MLTKKISPLLVALVATVTASSAWALPAATGYNYVDGTYTVRVDNKTSFGTQNDEDSGAYISVEAAKKGTGFEASAEATGGALKAFAATSISTGPSVQWSTSHANAYAGFTDYISFTGGSGESSATFLSGLSGTLSGEKYGSANYTYSVTLYDADGSWWTAQELASGDRRVSGKSKVSLNDEYETEFDFTFGKTYRLVATLQVEAQNGGYADFSDTATLNFDVASGVGLVSASGYTYNVPAVPEPQTYAMLLAGLGMISVMARRRTKM